MTRRYGIVRVFAVVMVAIFLLDDGARAAGPLYAARLLSDARADSTIRQSMAVMAE